MMRQSTLVKDYGSELRSGDGNSGNTTIIINYSEEDDDTQVGFVWL